jgi:hypothetical protein
MASPPILPVTMTAQGQVQVHSSLLTKRFDFSTTLTVFVQSGGI